MLADHKKMRRAPSLVLSERMQQRYAGLMCDVAEGLFTVTNPAPKPGCCGSSQPSSSATACACASWPATGSRVADVRVADR